MDEKYSVKPQLKWNFKNRKLAPSNALTKPLLNMSNIAHPISAAKQPGGGGEVLQKAWGAPQGPKNPYLVSDQEKLKYATPPEAKS